VHLFPRFRRARVRFAARSLVVALIGALAAVVPPTSVEAVVQPPTGFSISTVLSGLANGPGGNPTQFAYAPDGRIFVARKTGVVNVWQNGVQHTYVDLRTEVNSYQSRGLIGMTLDPNFATNGRVYLLFTKELDTANPDSPEPAGGDLISLTNVAGQPNVANLSSRVTLMTGYNSYATLHSVASLRFAADGASLFVGLGDGNGNGVGDGQAITAQDLDQLNGKILRINATTGNGVASNPYYQSATPHSVRSRVFARGFRNPFRFTVDPNSGALYVGDVGWNTWETFRVIPLTTSNPTVERNAGWPCYEGGDGVSLVQPDYATSPITGPTCHALYTPAQGGTGPGAQPPLYGYRHSDPGGENGSAIGSGPRYLGTSNYPSSYNGKVFVFDYARSRVQTVDLATGNATDFGVPGGWENPVDMQIAPSGRIAFLAFGTAELNEIVANGSNNPPVAVADADVKTTTNTSLTVHFTSAGSSDPDGNPITYSWNFGDGTALSTAANPAHTYGTGVFEAVLTVKDSLGATGTAKVQIAVGVLPPKLSFSAPLPTFRFKIDDTIPITLKAKSPQDGKLVGDSVFTKIEYWTSGHVYPVTEFNGLTGSFVAADQGFQNAFYRITSTATDSHGLSTTKTRDVLPQTVSIKVVSLPSGAPVEVDGFAKITNFSFTTIVGSAREASAPASFVKNGRTWVFKSWTVGSGTPTTNRFITYTAPSSALTITATYQ
jgi:glucose/arabinose dehydrogenase/PKD repeat protein